MRDTGDHIRWRSLNGTYEGVIIDILDTGYLVERPNGKHVIVNDCSVFIEE